MPDTKTDAALIRQIVEWTEDLGPVIPCDRTEPKRINYRRELPRVSPFGEQIAWVMNQWPDERKRWPGRQAESSAVHQKLFEAVRMAWRIEQSRLWQKKVISEFELSFRNEVENRSLRVAQMSGASAQVLTMGSVFDFRDDVRALNSILDDVLGVIRNIRWAISDAILGFQESAKVHCQRLIDYYIGELTTIRFEQLTAEVLLQSFYNQSLTSANQFINAPDWDEGRPPSFQAVQYKPIDKISPPVTLYNKYNRGHRSDLGDRIGPETVPEPAPLVDAQIATGPLFASLYSFLSTGRTKQRLDNKVFEWECSELTVKVPQALPNSNFQAGKAELMADAFDLLYHLATTYISAYCVSSSNSKADDNIFTLPLQLTVNQFAEFRGLRSSNAKVRSRHKTALEALGSVRLIRTGQKRCDAFVIDWQNSPQKTKSEIKAAQSAAAEDQGGTPAPESSKKLPAKHFSFSPGSILASSLRIHYENTAIEEANKRIVLELNCSPSTYREPVHGAHYNAAMWSLKTDSYRQMRQLLRFLRLDWRENIAGYVCLDVDHARDKQSETYLCNKKCVPDKYWRTWGELFDGAGIDFFASYYGHHSRAVEVWLKMVGESIERKDGGRSRTAPFFGRFACHIESIEGKKFDAFDPYEFLAKRVWLPPAADVAEKLRLSGYRQSGNQKSAASKVSTQKDASV